MLGLFHLAQKSCLAGKLFLTHLPSLPSLPYLAIFKFKACLELTEITEITGRFFLFLKKKRPYSLFSLAYPWKLKCSKSLFVKCTYCMVVSRLIPFEFLLWSLITECFSFSSKFRNFRLEIKWNGPFQFGPTEIFGNTVEGGPLWLVWSFLSVGRTEMSLSIWQNCFPQCRSFESCLQEQ